MSITIGALLGAAALGSGIGVLGNVLSNVQNHDYAVDDAKMSLENSKALMDYQNEYNLPVNQMQRYKDAGLNPNLIYQNGANSLSVNPSTVGNVDSRPSPLDFRAIFDAIQAAKENVRADKSVENDTQRVINDSKALGSQLDTDILIRNGLVLENNHKSLENASLALENSVNGEFARAMAASKLHQMQQEGIITAARAADINNLLSLQSDLIKAQVANFHDNLKNSALNRKVTKYDYNRSIIENAKSDRRWYYEEQSLKHRSLFDRYQALNADMEYQFNRVVPKELKGFGANAMRNFHWKMGASGQGASYNYDSNALDTYNRIFNGY